MRVKSAAFAAFLMLLLASSACRHEQQNVTGAYGAHFLSGQVSIASTIGNQSPAGVRVSVAGTGMSMLVGEDGRFAFVDVPENVTLRFSRDADGIDAALPVTISGKALSVEVATTTASTNKSSRRRSVSPPYAQFEGTVVSATDASLVMLDSHNQEVTVALTAATSIRKGQTALTAADLKAGDRIHVSAMVNDGVKTAVQVIVQEAEDGGKEDGTPAVTANGLVSSVAADQMVVHRANGDDVTVNVNADTKIKKHGVTIPFTDIKVGDHVESLGTRVDDHTILARQIEVQDAPGQKKEAEVSGTVTSVSATGLVVGGTTVKVDGTTTIRKQGKSITLSDIKPGDVIDARGTRVDETTILATEIEVRGGGGHH